MARIACKRLGDITGLDGLLDFETGGCGENLTTRIQNLKLRCIQFKMTNHLTQLVDVVR